MTASNPCCERCGIDGDFEKERYCQDRPCPCHKETPAAVEKASYAPHKMGDHSDTHGGAGDNDPCYCDKPKPKPQPEKEWWEAAIAEATRDICSVSVAPASKSEVRRILEVLADRIAAQSEKKGRNAAVDYILTHHKESHPWGMSSERFETYSAMLERARSSEEGKTTQAGR